MDFDQEVFQNISNVLIYILILIWLYLLALSLTLVTILTFKTFCHTGSEEKELFSVTKLREIGTWPNFAFSCFFTMMVLWFYL